MLGAPVVREPERGKGTVSGSAPSSRLFALRLPELPMIAPSSSSSPVHFGHGGLR